MIGVVILPDGDDAAYYLHHHTPMPLLPLGDRPIIQHLVEFLAHQGIRQLELVLEHAPERVEHYLGDGTRWGCRFRYHLIAQPGRPYRPLSIISGIGSEPWLLVHAGRFPYVSFAHHFGDSRPVAFFDGATSSWLGAALFPAGKLDDAVLRGSKENLDAYVETLRARGAAKAVSVERSIGARTPAELLAAQQCLLDRTFADLMIGGNENESGVWISRNVVIHPSAQVHPPVYLGPNSRLGKGTRTGPYAVISENCIVDAHTVVRDSLILPGSYVGEHLEVCDSIVSRNLLVNARLDTAVTIHESFLLGNLNGSPRRNWLTRLSESAIAILLIVLFSPLLAAAWVYLAVSRRGAFTSTEVVELPSEDSPPAWRIYKIFFANSVPWAEHPAAGWKSFFGRFLPGLFAVARGRLSLVGLPPRTRQEILDLPEDWRSLYLAGKSGLISEAAISWPESGSSADMYLVEACYCGTRGPRHDLNLFVRYFIRLLSGQLFKIDAGRTPASARGALRDVGE